MQPVSTQDSPAQFKGDVDSVYEALTKYFETENNIYLEFIKKIQYKSFDIYEFMMWRTMENKVNSHRFFLPLVDAVIGDMYVYQNLNASQTQMFSLNLEKYVVFKDSVRESLTMLDPYLIFCSMYQVPPSYSGYLQWLTFQQGRAVKINTFKEQLIPDNTSTFREDVFEAYVSDQNNPLTVQEYTKFFDNFVENQKAQDSKYAEFVQQVKNSIQNINMFVFNDLLVAYQKQGGQISKESYQFYYAQVLKKFDLEHLNTMNEEYLQAEKEKLSKTNNTKNNSQDQKIGVMSQQQEQLASTMEDATTGMKQTQTEQGLETINQDQAQYMLKQAQKCLCCKGNVYGCEGEICRLLGNCVCLSE